MDAATAVRKRALTSTSSLVDSTSRLLTFIASFTLLRRLTTQADGKEGHLRPSVVGDAYECLVQLCNKIGWQKLLVCRSQVFLSEGEGPEVMDARCLNLINMLWSRILLDHKGYYCWFEAFFEG
jgi:hypothetical protein